MIFITTVPRASRKNAAQPSMLHFQSCKITNCSGLKKTNKIKIYHQPKTFWVPVPRESSSMGL